MLLIAENPESAMRYIRDSVREILSKSKQVDVTEEEVMIECAKLPPFKIMFSIEELDNLKDTKVFLVPGVENHPEFNRYMLALKVAGIPGLALDISKFYTAEDLTKLPDSASVKGLVGKLKGAGKSNATNNS